MLENNDREKIQEYVEKILKSIYSSVKKNIESGMSNQDVIESAVNLTVNKLTPESKMVLSSVYNMLMENTLKKPLYQNAQNKAAFYSRDILKDLNTKFSFEVPAHIDYEESKSLINKWTVAGAICVGGGVVSITMKNAIPIVIAVIIAGVMLYLLRDKPSAGNKQDISTLIKEYLKNVKATLMSWVDEISAYYDEEVKELEKGMI
ncbi:MAG: hypothetical protein K6G87_00590 [Butyrivibrio sp.]|uniref:hypothetical protein n=1 Tax=Butyrivibrio sp. TaxID=28121 RepID=UPI0025FABCB8|nr:hypothetical protein [Butyrivibrio sp.]MCR5769708.1 hypothetical protein [Butyrivibrio sp.]